MSQMTHRCVASASGVSNLNLSNQNSVALYETLCYLLVLMENLQAYYSQMSVAGKC